MRYEIPEHNIFEKISASTAKTVGMYACGAAAAVIAAFYVGNKIAGYFGAAAGVDNTKNVFKPHDDNNGNGENSDNNSNNGK